MNNITTTAARMKKPTKAKALDALKATLDSGTIDGNEHHLAVLYSFFMPPGPSTKAAEKDNFAWVALATSKDDVRDYLNYVYVTEDHITATDGHRMHRVPNLDGMEPGFYHPNGEKAGDSDWQKFPDVERVIPTEQTHSKRSFSTENLPVVEIGGNIYAYQHDANPTRHLNKFYVDAALAGAQMPVSALIADDSSSVVGLRYGVREAIVMPLRA